MLAPDYLENVPAALMRLWQQVEDDILRDVARRIGKMGEVTETADWQLWRREQTRLCNREVLKILARYSGKSEAELRRIFQEAAAKALEADDRLYTSAGLDPPAPNEDPALLNLLNAGYEQTAGSWQNLTATTAQTVSGQFEAALDRAWLQVASGAFDYKTAVRRAVNGLADHMAGVTYPTGHRDTLEVAVRRAVLTGVNQTAGKLQLARMEEMNWAFVETSAHAGARPEHAKWQGRQFHRGGAVTYGGRHYPDFVGATGYGTGAGLCGWNCRHSFFAIDPDLAEPAYTEEELAALDAKNIAYKGKMYTKYEISQKQRALERKVRAAKRRYLAEDAAGLDTAQSAVRLRQARQNLAQFIRDTGSRNDSARTFVQGFGRSEASRATAQAKGVLLLADFSIGRSVGAKAKNYTVIDKETGAEYHFTEGTKIQNAQVFAGKGVSKPLREEVARGLSEQFGGEPQNWQHCKGIGWLDVNGESIKAEVHWFQNDGMKERFKVKYWLYDED